MTQSRELDESIMTHQIDISFYHNNNWFRIFLITATEHSILLIAFEENSMIHAYLFDALTLGSKKLAAHIHKKLLKFFLRNYYFEDSSQLILI